MPTYSSEYIYFMGRVRLIASKFMDDQVADELANPSTFTPDIERIAAFRLLVHAEIEDYIEKKAKEWIKTKEALVSTSKYNVNSLLDIFPISILLKEEMYFEIPFDINKFSTNIKYILGQAKKIIDENNGIKRDSFMKLSMFCGKGIDEIDDTIAILLNDFGKARGDVAHKSSDSVKTILGPSTELNKANEIVKALGFYFYS